MDVQWTAGTGEPIFEYNGRRFQYGYCPNHGHIYYCLTDDIFYRDFATLRYL